MCRVSGQGKSVEEEIARVESVGGWIADGRVCDILAVSRAFGDTEFKGQGLQHMVASGVECVQHLLPVSALGFYLPLACMRLSKLHDGAEL